MAANFRFSKMHGAGNDFVLVDLRNDTPAPDVRTLRLLADRHRGVGCDQVLTIEPPHSAQAIAAYRIWNADGTPAQQCGNGARCVAAWLRRDAAVSDTHFVLDSPSGTHAVDAHADDDFTIAMGNPDFAPASIPLLVDVERSLYSLDVHDEPILFGAVSMGNPHALIEVTDVAAAPVHKLGAAIQAMREFSDSVNVGFAQVIAPDRIKLRVFERGVGETLACGSGACAAVAILVRQGCVDRDVAVELPGGTLRIAWPRDDAPISMRGPATFVFEGEWNP
ncbi:MAG: diaminopimelate epimerase [Lysobacteraceae bacterium]